MMPMKKLKKPNQLLKKETKIPEPDLLKKSLPLPKKKSNPTFQMPKLNPLANPNLNLMMMKIKEPAPMIILKKLKLTKNLSNLFKELSDP